MSKSRHTEAQIIAALKQIEAGRMTEDVAREPGVSKQTIYAWKAKYGGMEVSVAEEINESVCWFGTSCHTEELCGVRSP